MHRTIARTILATLTALGMLIGVGVLSASANTRRDCYIIGTARLSVTSWPNGVNPQFPYTLHMDENGYYPSSGLKMYPRAIVLDGVTQAGTQDIYTSVSSAPHTIQGWFTGSNGSTYMCSVSGYWR